MAALKKKIRGKILDLLKSGIRTKDKAMIAKKQWQKRGWRYVTIVEESDGYAIYGI